MSPAAFLVPLRSQHDLPDVLARLQQRVGLVGLRESEVVRINQRPELTGVDQLGGLAQDLAMVRAAAD